VQTSLSTGLWVTWRDLDVGVGADIVIDAFTGDVACWQRGKVAVVGMDVVDTGVAGVVRGGRRGHRRQHGWRVTWRVGEVAGGGGGRGRCC